MTKVLAFLYITFSLCRMASADPSPPQQPVIGLLAPLTGKFASFGQKAVVDAELALQLAAEKPVLSPLVRTNKQITLIVVDSKGTVKDTEAAIEKLVNVFKVQVLMGDILQETALPIAQKAKALGVPVVIFAKKDDVTQTGNNVFRVGLTPANQSSALANKAVSSLGLKKLVVFYPKHPLGTQLKEAFARTAKSSSKVSVLEIGYDPKQTTFTAEAQKIAAAKEVDGIFIADFPTATNYIVKALVAADIFRKTPSKPNFSPPTLLGINAWNTPELITRLGKSIEGAVFCGGIIWQEDNPLVEKFRSQFQNIFTSPPTLMDAEIYDAAQLVMQALLRYNQNRETQPGKTLADEIMATQLTNALTGTLRLDAQRNGAGAIHWMTVKNGEIKELVDNAPPQ